MDLKDFLKNLTKYNKNYNFTIINDKIDTPPEPNTKDPNVFPNITENLDFLKSKYNTLISPDIKIREFNMFALNKNYKCFIIYIDGLVDSISINELSNSKPFGSSIFFFSTPQMNTLTLLSSLSIVIFISP